jgi:hypothetical protein
MLECLEIQKNLQNSAVAENKGCFAGFRGLYPIKNNLLSAANLINQCTMTPLPPLLFRIASEIFAGNTVNKKNSKLFKLVLHPVVRGNYEWFECKNGPRSTMHAGGKYFFLVVANKTQNTQPENWPASFTLRPDCDNLHAWSTLGVRKMKVLRKLDRRAYNAGKTCNNFRVFSLRKRTFYARGSYFPLAFNVRVNKWGESALPPCVYYLLSKCMVSCEARHTQTTHVTSTIKVCQKYAHNVGN